MMPADDSTRRPGSTTESGHAWLDADAGPVVRPYAVTGGRARPVAGGFDLVAFVVATPEAADADLIHLQPEHRALLTHAGEPTSVAELASSVDLAIGVVRVLLGDLLHGGLIEMYEPGAAAQRPDERVLKAVINGLRSL